VSEVRLSKKGERIMTWREQHKKMESYEEPRRKRITNPKCYGGDKEIKKKQGHSTYVLKSQKKHRLRGRKGRGGNGTKKAHTGVRTES